MHFIRIIRPLNLLVMALAMCGAWYYIMASNAFQFVRSNNLDFALLVISTLMIAAAGNIINDYFDVRADRINRPERLIITKHMKRRWAILIHWLLNGVAFLIGAYLSFKYSSLWFVFIHLISINLLWFYSLLLKKKVLIGNLIIAALTGTIPLLVVVFFKVSNSSSYDNSEFLPESWTTSIDFSLLYVLAGLSFIQNLCREIVKDLEDIKGDKHIHVTSLGMIIGNRPTLVVVSLLCLMLPVFTVMLLVHWTPFHTLQALSWPQLAPIYAAGILNLVFIGLACSKQGTEKLIWLDYLLKSTLLIGIMSCITIPYFSS
jgi:4-hydroxybenzoate polyprenyltransferase